MKKQRKALALVLAVLLLAAALPLDARAASSCDGVVIASSLNMRSGAGAEYDLLAKVPRGTTLTVIGIATENSDWFKVSYNGQEGYMSSEYIINAGSSQAAAAIADAAAAAAAAQAAAQAAQNAPQPTPAPAPAPTPVYVPANSAGGQQIVDTAMQFQGVPYVWGGTSPQGFDCSGLVYYTYQLCGYSINRVAQSIYTGTGTAVGRDQLAPGDIICFGNSSYVWHVGIYIGNNQFIHAPNTGSVVRVESLSGTYANNFVCAKRVV